MTQSKRPEFLQGEEHTHRTITGTGREKERKREREREEGYVTIGTTRKDAWSEAHRHSMARHGTAWYGIR